MAGGGFHCRNNSYRCLQMWGNMPSGHCDLLTVKLVLGSHVWVKKNGFLYRDLVALKGINMVFKDGRVVW